MKRIGFLGLGIMGRGMAVNLVQAGYPLTVWNRTKDKALQLAELGALIAENPAQAASNQDVIITMLADPKAVENVAYRPDGILAGIRPGSILIDSSTVDPHTSLKLAAAVKAKEAHFLDAPVAGSKKAAEEGQLIMMVGGSPDTLASVRPILETMSKQIIHAGPVGMGTYLKLCFNLIVSHMAAALSEGLLLGAKAGLDPSLILETIGAGIIASKFYDWKGQCILNRDFSTNFSLRLMHKDLNLIMSAAYELDVPLPVTAVVKELFGTAKSCANPDDDFSSVIRALESVANFEVHPQPNKQKHLP